MAFEDFTTYTEVDPDGVITVTSSKVDYVNLNTRQTTSYVYSDKGVNHFDGDFTHDFTFYFTQESNDIVTFWMVANDIGDFRAIDNAGGSFISVVRRVSNNWISLEEVDSGTNYRDSYIGGSGSIWYCTLVRDETVGTYGTAYLYMYSDASRTTLVDTLTVALHTSKKDFRYLYVCSSWNDSTISSEVDGYTENLDLNESLPPALLTNLYDLIGAVNKDWSLISDSKYTPTPTDTNTLAMSDTSDMWVGAPIAFKISGVTYCARVKSIVANTSIDVQGAPLSASLTDLYVGRSGMVKLISLFVPSTYADGTNDNLLTVDAKNPMTNRFGGTGYVVYFEASHNTVDSTTQPKINLEVNNAVVSTNDSNNGLQMSGSANTLVANSDVAINTSNYDWQVGEELEVACKAAGGTGDASDLTVQAAVIITSKLP